MQSEILEQLRQAFTTPGALEALADRLGTDRRGVQRALTFGVPVALGGLHAAVTRGPAPWTAAAASLGDPESLGSVVAGGPTPTGRTLAEQAFGSRLDAVTESLAGTAGIPASVAGDTLATMVPLALLASRDEAGELTPDALVSRLGSAAEESAASVPGGAAAVAAVLTAAPPAAATATAVGPPTGGEAATAGEPAAATSSRPAWPLWLGVGVLAAILVAGGIWLATRGGDSGGATTTAAPVSSTASDGTITIASTTAPSNDTTAAASTTEAASTSEAPTAAPPATVPAAVQQMNDLAKGTLVFEPSSTTLSADAGAALDQIATILKDNPDLDVFVDGHTDNLGKADQNQQLSELRANVVVAELTSRGVARDRLTPRGFGGDRPIADNSTPEGQAANRRIEFTYRP